MITAIIMAAGKGTRMRSDLPKVLHIFNGRPFIEGVFESVKKVADEVVVVLGHKAEEVLAVLPATTKTVIQEKQLGTGDAVRTALVKLSPDTKTVLVIPGDCPHILPETLSQVLQVHQQHNFPLTLATVVVPDYEDWRQAFMRFGRIVRGADGSVNRIVEYKDATEAEKELREVNVSMYAFDVTWLQEHINLIKNENATGEIYLTDLVGIAKETFGFVTAVQLKNIVQGLSVNSPEELLLLESVYNVS